MSLPLKFSFQSTPPSPPFKNDPLPHLPAPKKLHLPILELQSPRVRNQNQPPRVVAPNFLRTSTHVSAKPERCAGASDITRKRGRAHGGNEEAPWPFLRLSACSCCGRGLQAGRPLRLARILRPAVGPQCIPADASP